ncbi:aminoglycoside N(3)-acetyltransferase [Streptomyces polygonati]|uniref:Aminoglycoside N(3)-acetyltransferase n=1 Tax=Streptomyces polygonati TaxID=1617087 RepID=A0ABV8HUP0_9ACTN
MFTEESLTADLRRLGVGGARALLMHSSLRSVGLVRGGSLTVVRALRRALGPGGTLVVPTFTEGNSLTSRTHRRMTAGLTDSQTLAYRERMEPFDSASTPSYGMGRIAEEVRTTAGALRSRHPQTSFAAIGPLAARVTTGHPLDCLLGERSPLGRLYDNGAQILLLGVGFEVCSAFHLSEYRVPAPVRRPYYCKVATEDGPRWIDFSDVDLDDRDFGEVGQWVETLPHRGHGLVLRGRVGDADARLLPLVPAVDAAASWMTTCRSTAGQLSGEGDRA